MLVLTRRSQEQIKIGDQITVTILRVKGSTVRVGIQAPREVRVVRGELPKQEGQDSVVEITADVTNTPAIDDKLLEASDESHGDMVLSFRIPRMAAETPALRAETMTQVSASKVSAGHLPLRRIHDRLGGGPLKQLMASCATLDS